MKKTLLTIIALAATFCLSGCVVATYDEPYPPHPRVFHHPPGPIIEVIEVPCPPPGPHPFPRHPHHPRPHPW
ncbi:MAG: hypothetical protein ABFD90_10100 [Phycisphaerales bacterium]